MEPTMKLRLRREPTILDKVTLGDLYIQADAHDEVWQCHTLEDAVREVPGSACTVVEPA
jgi:hypothetical protein